MRSKINKCAAFIITLIIFVCSANICSVYASEASHGFNDANVVKNGNITADAYRYFANQTVLEGEQEYDIAILFMDTEPSADDHLVFVFLSGKDIKNIAELYASYYSNILPEELYTSGLAYEFNLKRPKLDRVSDIYLAPSMLESSRSELYDDKTYRTVTDTHSLDVIQRLSGYSLGIVKIDNGVFSKAGTVNDESGEPAGTYTAYEKYITSFFDDADDIVYDSLTLRRKVDSTYNPSAFFKNTSRYFYIFTGIIILLIIAVVIITRVIILRKHKKKVFVE